MEEIIKKIIDIEDKAQKIIDDAIDEKKQRENEHKLKVDGLEDQIINDAKHKVEQIRQREFDEIREQEEAKVARCEKRLVQMDKYAQDNMDTWVKDLVERVLS